MKSIRTLLFSVICAAFAMTAFSQCSPAIEELTLNIPFKCNAYVTPLNPASKVTPSLPIKSLPMVIACRTMPK